MKSRLTAASMEHLFNYSYLEGAYPIQPFGYVRLSTTAEY